jgi:hypothetical protein
MKELFFYNDNTYSIIRKLRASYFYKKEELNRELLNKWKEYLGAEHILKTDTHFLMVETVKEPEWNEIKENEEQLQPEEQTV